MGRKLGHDNPVLHSGDRKLSHPRAGSIFQVSPFQDFFTCITRPILPRSRQLCTKHVRTTDLSGFAFTWD